MGVASQSKITQYLFIKLLMVPMARISTKQCNFIDGSAFVSILLFTVTFAALRCIMNYLVYIIFY